MEPVPIRWVLLKDPAGKGAPAALLCTDPDMGGADIVSCFIRRWTVEVTLKEVRTHLGVATQRQWSDKAIASTTPCLMGLFSITALWADKRWHSGGLGLEQTGWYQQKLPTFSDALAAVSKQLWAAHHYCISTSKGQTAEIMASWLNFLTSLLARANWLDIVQIRAYPKNAGLQKL
jgi:hypothetical protein